MKKRILSILLAGMLLASAAGSAFAVTDGDSEVWSAPRSGFEIRIPEAYHDAKTYITFADSGEGVNPGCGIVSASATCVMMPEAEYKALQAMMEEAYEKDDIDKLFEIIIRSEQCVGCSLCVARCEQHALYLKDGRVEIDPDECIRCRSCLGPCPAVNFRATDSDM